jgi:hypothetical protein
MRAAVQLIFIQLIFVTKLPCGSQAQGQY